MTTRVQTTWTGDTTTTETFEFVGDKLAVLTARYDTTGTEHDRLGVANYTYDELGRRTGEKFWQDNDGDGVFADDGMLTRTFNGDTAQVVREFMQSPDLDGDGVAGDYGTDVVLTYNAAGQMTVRDTIYTAWGGIDYSSTAKETWTYDTKGRPTSYVLDDPAMYDCEITELYRYNKGGQLQDIREVNEIQYGDLRPRIETSFTYNKDGSLKTKTDWADYADDGQWYQRVDTAYTWKPAYESQLIKYDVTGDFKAENIKKVETWYNAKHEPTDILISEDFGGNGGKLAGGFDARTKIDMTWADGILVEETRDHGLDGLDYIYTDVLVA